MGFSGKLISWYHQNKRDLPWRNTKDPYQIWLSEIILQQTRVDQGLNYFNKFIEHYPTIDALANAPEKDVLKLWQGLGYYSRARNLHFTAKRIAKEYKGVFPDEYDAILNLKGVGEYTAAAISSFAFSLSYPVIDGNVYRVLSRVFGINTAIDSTNGKKEFKKIAEELIDDDNPATYNQAIMEFGALQCSPKKPKCEDCPFRLECFALNNDLIAVLPKKEKKIKQRNRYFNYIVILDDGYIYLKERKEKDIWIGLYDFPLVETNKQLNSFANINKVYKSCGLSLIQKSETKKHILSHQKIYATFWLCSASNASKLNPLASKISLKEINNYPVPKLIENYLKTIL